MAAIETLDRILGFAEFILVPASLLWLVVAWWRPTARRIRRSTVLALVVALTVAQPFGVIASIEGSAFGPPTPIQDPYRLEPRQTNGEDVHVARVFGIPLLPFRLYSRENLWWDQNTPRATLRARSWFWLPVLTHATRIAEICENYVFAPCWEPEPGSGRAPTYLTVSRDGDTERVKIDDPAGRTRAELPDSFTWKLRVGIASPAGLGYWVLAAGLVIAGRRRRSGLDRSNSTGIASVQTHSSPPR